MAGLDVHTVKTCFRRHPGCLNEALLQDVQIVVRDQRVVGRQTERGIQNRTVVSDDRPGLALGFGVASGVCELQNEQQVLPPVRVLTGGVNHALERVQTPRVQVELVRVGAGLGDNGCRLEPDQAAATVGVAPVPAERQLPGAALVVGVEALHRVDGETVCQLSSSDGDRLQEDLCVLREREIQAQFLSFGEELFERVEAERVVSGHLVVLAWCAPGKL